MSANAAASLSVRAGVAGAAGAREIATALLVPGLLCAPLAVGWLCFLRPAKGDERQSTWRRAGVRL